MPVSLTPYSPPEVVQTAPYNSFGMYTPNAYAVNATLPSASVGLPAGLESYYSNPLYQMAMGGAPIGGGIAKMNRVARNLEKAFTGNLAFANQALNLAFDPQQGEFLQRQQDLIDATRAGEAARGISMSPFGAGIEADALGRFYNDWENERVARMSQGVSAASALQGIYAQAQAAAGGLYNNAIQARLQEYGIKGTMISNAMNEILQGLDIQTKAAIASMETQGGILGAQISASGHGGRGGGGGGGGLGMSFESGSGGGSGIQSGGG